MGCSAHPQVPSRERFAVESGVVLMIEDSLHPAGQARKVVHGVGYLQRSRRAQYVTVEELRSALMERLSDADLDDLQQADTLRFIRNVSDALDTRIRKDLISRNAIISVEQALGWSEAMALLYLPPAPERAR